MLPRVTASAGAFLSPGCKYVSKGKRHRLDQSHKQEANTARWLRGTIIQTRVASRPTYRLFGRPRDIAGKAGLIKGAGLATITLTRGTYRLASAYLRHALTSYYAPRGSSPAAKLVRRTKW